MSKCLSAVAALMLAAGAMVSAQERRPSQAVDAGHDLYLTYCATCHGITARGDGPTADEFRRRPPDLTRLAKANGGVFNDELIRRVIDGRSVKSHGNLEMPVWGDAFRWRLGLNEEAVRQRIRDLVVYLESIQQRAAH